MFLSFFFFNVASFYFNLKSRVVRGGNKEEMEEEAEKERRERDRDRERAEESKQQNMNIQKKNQKAKNGEKGRESQKIKNQTDIFRNSDKF